MMQLLLLALAMGVFAHDALVAPTSGTDLGTAAAALLWWGPELALAGLYWALCEATRRRLASPDGERAMSRLEWTATLYRLLVLGLYGLDLATGVLAWLRAEMGGNPVLLDDLAIMAPALGLLVWQAWAYYPIERRIREASLIGRMDADLPIYPPPTRGQYVLAHVRHQMVLILVPILLIMGWTEAVRLYSPPAWRVLGVHVQPLLLIAGAGGVFLTAPLIIRHLWDTLPLPPGPMRGRLTAMCRRHHVRVRELLLWRTFGGMINAAVMGLIAPLRYILLSDGLIEMIPADEVEAVMAHELAHVRKHHMFWMLLAAAAALGGLELGLALGLTHLDGLLVLVGAAGSGPDAAGSVLPEMLRSPRAVLAVTVTGSLLGWIFLFGWVSRRIELQADAFAVRHLAESRVDPDRNPRGRIVVDGASAATMIDALEQVARLNHVSPGRRDWRHGSIEWRQGHLRRLVGRPVDDLPIDRRVRGIRLLSVAALALVVLVQWILPV